jgi:hypothetical protein
MVGKSLFMGGFMKRIIVLCLWLLRAVPSVYSQSVLAPGDLALLGANCDNPDDFAFLVLVDIVAGSAIKFTDNGWQAAGSFRSGEGILTFTAATNLDAGTVIVYSENQLDFSSSGSFSLSSSGDQILVYQGDETSPQFIYGLNIEGAAVWQSDATNTNSSALPSGLSNGLSAVAVQEFDNVKYNGSTQFPDPIQALVTISDPVNWSGDDLNRFDFTTWGDFSLPVELSVLNARAGNKVVELSWITESERNNAGFEIWRSEISDSNYQMISSYIHNPVLRGKMTSTRRTEYTFTDLLVVNERTYWYMLRDVSTTGQKTFHGPVSATPHESGQNIINVGLTDLPESFELYQNFPNPFNPTTTIAFDIPQIGEENKAVVLIIFNSLGQRVRTLYQGQVAGGRYSTVWDGKDDSGNHLPAGIYYATLRAGFVNRSIKLMLVK